MTFRTTSKRGWSIEWGVQLRPNGAWWLPDNSNICFLFFTMRTGPFSKCENRSDSQMGCQVRTWAVLTGRISPLVRKLQSGSFDSWQLRFSLRTGMKTGYGFQPMDENRPTVEITSVGQFLPFMKNPWFWCNHKRKGKVKKNKPIWNI